MIQVEHLSKVYGKGENEVVALNDVSFSVKKGEFVAIIGPSGSGKSTLLHILGGVDRPTKGKVYFDGVDVYQQKEDQLAIFRRRQVGLIYQFYNLIPILNVLENMTLPVLMDGREVNQEFLTELVATLGLEGKENQEFLTEFAADHRIIHWDWKVRRKNFPMNYPVVSSRGHRLDGH